MKKGATLMGLIGESWVAWALEREGIRRAEAFVALTPETETYGLRRLWATLARLHAFSIDGPNGSRRPRKLWNMRVASRRPRLRWPARSGRTRLPRRAWHSTMKRRLRSTKPRRYRIFRRFIVSGSRSIGRLLLDRRGEIDRAAAEFERLWRGNQSLGNSFNWGMAFNLANVEAERGLHRRSLEIIEEVLPGIRSNNDKQYFARALSLLATCRSAVGDRAGARSAAREAVEDYVSRKLESVFVIAAVEELALWCALEGDPSAAAVLGGYVEAALRDGGHHDLGYRHLTEVSLRDALEGRLAPAELTRLKADGERLSLEDATALALEATAES